MSNEYAPRVLHFGPYEGEEIDAVVEMDPEYILWIASTTVGHGIGEDALLRARQLIDEPYDPYLDDDIQDIEEQFITFGDSRHDFD